MIMDLKQATHLSYTINLLFFRYYVRVVTDMIKKLKLRLLVVIILFKIEVGHAQISVPKIGKPMSKTACINSCM